MDYKVKTIRCDNETEFKNRIMNEVYEMKGITRECSVARTPQQIGVAKRKNKTLIEAARTMLADSKLPTTFWVEAVNNASIKPALSFMRPFGCPVTILNTLDLLGLKSSEDEVADDAGKKSTEVPRKENGVQDPAKEGDKMIKRRILEIKKRHLENNVNKNLKDCLVKGRLLTLTSLTDLILLVHQLMLLVLLLLLWIQEEKEHRNEFKSMFGQDKDANGNNTYKMFTPVSAARSSYVNLGGPIPVNAVTLPNANLPTDPRMPDLEDTVDLQDTGLFSGAYDDEVKGAVADFNNLELTTVVSLIPTTRIHKDHPKEQIIRDPLLAPQTRRMTKTSQEHAMQSGYFWPMHNIYEVYYVPDGHEEYKLYGTIEEEVYVCQPTGFEDPYFLHKFYKVENALYSLHQAPRAWYDTLSTYLLVNGFRRWIIDKTLFIKKDKGDIMLVHVYVDDIIFGSTKKSLCKKFEGLMHKKFQMSSMGELSFFLGLQVLQRDDGIFISQDKYVANILKKFNLSSVKIARTLIETNKALLKDEEAEDVDVHLYRSMIGSLVYLTASRPDIMFVVCTCARFQVTPKVSHLHAVKRIFINLKGQPKLGLWYPRDSPFDLEAFLDSDYAEASLDRKSTIGDGISDEFRVKTGSDETANDEIQVSDVGLTYYWTMASAIICLATNKKFNFSKYIFDNMVKHLDGRVKFLMYPRFVQVFLDNQIKGMDRHNAIFVISSHTKKVFANMMKEGKDFSRKVTPLFATMMVQSPKDMGEDSKLSTDSHHTLIVLNHHPLHPRRSKNQEGNRGKKLKFLYQVVRFLMRKGYPQLPMIHYLVGRMNEKDMFGVNDLYGDEVVVYVSASKKVEQSVKVIKNEVSIVDPVTTAGEVVTTAGIEATTAATTPQISKDELTLAQTLIEIKAAKLKAIITAATIVTAAGTRPKEKGIVMQEPSETPLPKPIISSQQPSKSKYKGITKMIEPEKPLKRKDQIMIDEKVARNLEAQMQAELEEEERLSKQKEEEENIALIE
nr:uncharacterized mitochondrial protein AtMg00810-like [Tanacetum cinerariifolium]